MKLKKAIVVKVKANKKLRNRLASEFDKTDFSILRWLKENEGNGPLTTVTAVQIIREELALGDSQILEEETEPARA